MLRSHLKEEGKKFALINIGPTRADKLADIKVNSRAGLVLDKVLISSDEIKT